MTHSDICGQSRAAGCRRDIARARRLVAAAGLRGRNAALVEPGLQVRIGPLGVEPVTRIAGGLTGLVRRRLVVGAGGVE